MIKKLIEEGKVLQEERIKEIENLDKKGPRYNFKFNHLSKSMKNDDFNSWTAKLVDYLEDKYPNKKIANDVVESYPNINHDTSKEFYNKAMSVLYALDKN